MGKVIGRMPANESERYVCRRLAELSPDDWMIVPSRHYTIREKLRNGREIIRDGEVDAIVLVPEMGMVILEVKGTREVEVDDEGNWWRCYPDGGREKIRKGKLPHEQACKNMHNLAKQLLPMELGSEDFPGNYAWLVVYPRGRVRGALDLIEKGLVIDAPKMDGIIRSCRRALSDRAVSDIGHRFNAETVRRVKEILCYGRFHLTPVDAADEVEDDQRRIEELTQQQFAVLRGLLDWPSLTVAGPAGSGKTVIAIWHLQGALSEEKRAMYVCFNKNLPSHLEKLNPELSGKLWSIDRFFTRMANRAVPSDIDSQDRSQYFREDLPGFALDRFGLGEVGPGYDLIIIDEGQDFSETQLLVLRELLVEGGQLVIFADRRQDLFRAAQVSQYPTDAYFSLSYNCRNTAKINDAANGLTGANPRIDSMPGVPDGVSPEVIIAADRTTMAKEAWRLASQWHTQDGVVMLSPYRLENSCFANLRHGHGLSLSENLDAMSSGDEIYFSTVRSFKGLEASAVILVDAMRPSENDRSVFRIEDLYVACTRARARLAIICPNQEAGNWYQGMTRKASGL